MGTICSKYVSSIYNLLYFDKSSSTYVDPVRYFIKKERKKLSFSF